MIKREMDHRDILVGCVKTQIENLAGVSMETDDIQTEEQLKGIVTICSEESVTRAASSQLEEALNRFNKNNQDHLTGNVVDNENEAAKEKSGLERQVQMGEVSPFKMAQITNASKSENKRNFNEAFGLAGLENYLKKQAELSEQRKRLKNTKVTGMNKKESQKPCLQESASIQQKLSLDKQKKRIKKSLYREPEKTNHEISNPPNVTKESVRMSSKSNLSAVTGIDSDNQDSGSEYLPSDSEIEEDDTSLKKKKSSRQGRKKSRKDVDRQNENSISGGSKILDDGDDAIYKERMEARLLENSSKDVLFTVENLFKVPKSIWKKLYKYQKVSIRWLWELHGRGLGGLMGDEMGLGKTVQVIAFLAGLDVSELLSDGGRFRGLGPTIIVCPATLLEQWLRHFREWAPFLRVAVLHHSGTYRGTPEDLIENIVTTGGILITSYSGVLQHKEALLESHWHYIILDEGHKIRNPEAKVTRTVKRFSTPHRLLLTGSPMQNSLKELWSLFDFILPGKLGTQATFLEHCANPITRGGYANASPLQEATALQVATMLKDAIAPYMLRRTKRDVQHHIKLPEKNEQVLFCSLTEIQKSLYKEYLRTDHVASVLHDKSNQSENSYRARLLVALTNLRKICNHPDLYSYGNENVNSDEELNLEEESVEDFGHWKRSGKLVVVKSLLKIWKQQGHRALLFTQGRQMMRVLEALAQREGHKYLRLDGMTPMAQRQQTIHKFNNDSSYFVFISTTRVGGLGVNLTGANRVVIYDPDWNPAVDAQARERAWRIGQDKHVTIYRLITAGTVEEKIYHRQIFKLLLSNRILEDPRQRRLFQTSDLAELFNFNEPLDGTATESDRIFRDCKLEPKTALLKSNFSPLKIEAMKKLASSVSKKIEEIAKKTTEESKGQSPSDAPIPKKGKSAEKNRKKYHKEKKNRKAKISAIFEGEEVPCLIGRKLERSETNEEEDISSTCDDQYVLKKLFSKTCVSSAIQHDAVLSGARSDGGESNPMNRMARDTAQESMDLLRQSRKWCWRPTWDAPSNHE
ncbi:DNA excision repair protein ERCC-6-like [Venturia canescens]|uniref:DNA excision repair protein ERCC-6-like n=1 Tax=Venturia canescens TaxID=32260 RepID=UPI001C9BDAAE|nr:DNA excision repair protein ERCC-6-like [Venturia canescens]